MTQSPLPVLLEVPIASVEDALAAQTGGADRVELNAALDLGGLTPSLATIVEARRVVTLPCVVMLRPRPGGFCYSDHEFRTVLRDLGYALTEGANGLAFGFLTVAGEVDVARCREVIQHLPKDVEAVFHRAFDVTPDPHRALEQLIDLGFTRVMTSGQEATAYNGISRIAKLIDQAADRIEVLPAGGITRFTVADVVTRTGCRQVHASLRHPQFDRSTAARPQVRFGSPVFSEDQYQTTDADAVRAMKACLRSLR